MRHLLCADELAPGIPLFIFGAGAGGVLVHDALKRAGHDVRAFIDDTKSGSLGQVPILSVATFSAQAPAGAVVLIASQHWRAIGRRLKGMPAHCLDASPLIRKAARPTKRLIPCRELERVIATATGRSLDEVVDHLPRHPDIDRLFTCVGPIAPAPVPVYLHGNGAAARRMRLLLQQQSRLELVGFIDDHRAGTFIDFLDVCGFDAFTAEEGEHDPLVLVTSGPATAAAYRARGFSRVVDVAALAEEPVPTGARSAAAADGPPLSVVWIGADAGVPAEKGDAQWIHEAPAEGESFGAALLRAMRRCRGELIAVCAAGAAPSADLLEAAQAGFAANPDLAAIAGGGHAGLFDLEGYLFDGPMPGFPLRFLRRRAALDVGLEDEGWHVPAFGMELTCRLACDHHVVTEHGLDADPVGSSVALADAVVVLNRLCAGDGFFRANEALLRYGKARMFARAHNPPIAVPALAVEVHDAVAQCYDERGQIDHALAAWDRARTCKDATVDSLAVQALLKSPTATNADMLARQLEWARRHGAQPVRRMECAVGPGPVRLAYNCAFADTSYFTYQVLPFVAKHDRSKFHVTCYVDKVTAAVAASCDVAREVAHLDDRAFAEQVQADGIHILVEVTGFSPGHRYGAMALRAAPVQISYVNHMGTSGVPNVDWFIGDRVATPPGVECQFSERIYRLPGSFFCFDYSGDPAFPPVAPPPSATGAPVTFGCFGSGSKLNNRLVALWAALLKAAPKTRLALCNASLASAGNRSFMLRRFGWHGIGPERLVLHPGADRAGVLRLYGEVDVTLDTWPYCGGNTIAESLMMGVPVVTLSGATTAARYGASLLTASGCGELVARDGAEFIDKARALAADPDALVRYRQNLRQSMFEHGFSDAARFARAMEQAYVDMLDEVRP